MNTKQTNRLAMFDTVANYLDNNNSVWNAMQPMTTAVQAFKGKILDANTAKQAQETPTGATDLKAAARDHLEDVLFLTCEALTVLGHANNDLDLLSVCELTRTDLDRLPDDELITRANVLIEGQYQEAGLADVAGDPGQPDGTGAGVPAVLGS
jgi:hypothetical protein